MSSARFGAKSRIVARFAVVATLAALTAGCFQPMYAERSDGAPALRDKLATVEVPPLSYPNNSPQARAGVAIRNALQSSYMARRQARRRFTGWCCASTRARPR